MKVSCALFLTYALFVCQAVGQPSEDMGNKMFERPSLGFKLDNETSHFQDISFALVFEKKKHAFSFGPKVYINTYANLYSRRYVAQDEGLGSSSMFTALGISGEYRKYFGLGNQTLHQVTVLKRWHLYVICSIRLTNLERVQRIPIPGDIALTYGEVVPIIEITTGLGVRVNINQLLSLSISTSAGLATFRYCDIPFGTTIEKPIWDNLYQYLIKVGITHRFKV